MSQKKNTKKTATKKIIDINSAAPKNPPPKIKKKLLDTISILGVFDGQPWRQEADIVSYITDLGYKVKTYNYRGRMSNAELLDPNNQDLVLVLNGIGLPFELLKGIKSHMVLWNSELFNDYDNFNSTANYNFRHLKPSVPCYDALIFHDYTTHKAIKTLTDSKLWTVFGCGLREKLHIPRPKDHKPTKDVGIIGSFDDKREDEIKLLNEDLKKHGIQIDKPEKFLENPEASRDFAWDHKVMLNLHYTKTLNTENRIVEMLGFGVPIVSEELSMPEMFPENIKSGAISIAKNREELVKAIINAVKNWNKININRDELPKHGDLVGKVMSICEGVVKKPRKTNIELKPPPDIKLIAVLITKDVSSVLERCLKSIKGWVDEIVVLDNGSKDVFDCLNPNCAEMRNIKYDPKNPITQCDVCHSKKFKILNPTLDIAKKYADKVATIPEFLGFGPTRNEALKHVELDKKKINVALSIDADEWMNDDVGKILKNKIAENIRDGAMKVAIELKMNPDKEGKAANQFITDRIFRLDKGIKWKYYVHNELNVDTVYGSVDPSLYWFHSRAEMSPHDNVVRGFQRYDTNVKWLLKELEDYKAKGEDGVRSMIYLGNTNLDHKKPDEAIKWYNKVIDSTETIDARRPGVYLSIAQCYALKRQLPDERYVCHDCGHDAERDATRPLIRCSECASRRIETYNKNRIVPIKEMNDIKLREISHLQYALGAQPYDPSIYVSLAETQISMGNIKGAELTLKLCELVMQNVGYNKAKYPQLLGIPFLLHTATVHERMGRAKPALDAIEKALSIAPNNPILLKRKNDISSSYVDINFRVMKDRKNLTIFSPQHDFIMDQAAKWQVSGKYAINIVDTRHNQMPIEDVMRKQIEKSHVVWFEFGNEALVMGSKILATMKNKPKAIVRIHGYECHRDYFKHVNWDTIDRTIFVASYLYDIARRQDVRITTRKIDIVPGGINLKAFTINKDKKEGNKVAFAGFFNWKKDLHMGALVIKELHKAGNDMEYHIAAKVQDQRVLNTFMLHVENLGLANKVHIHDWQEDLNAWYADKDYFLSSSQEESLHYALAQGMAAGLKPIIRNWRSSSDFYKPEWIFDTPENAVKVFDHVKNMKLETFRKHIQDNLSLEKQSKALEEIIDA